MASALSDVRRRRAKVSECRKGPPLSPTSLSTGFALALSSEMGVKRADLAETGSPGHRNACCSWLDAMWCLSQSTCNDRHKRGMKAGSLLSHVKYAKPIGEKLRRMYGTMTNRRRYTLTALAAMDLGSGPCSYLFF